jgi:hypothetical protein
MSIAASFILFFYRRHFAMLVFRVLSRNVSSWAIYTDEDYINASNKRFAKPFVAGAKERIAAKGGDSHAAPNSSSAH